MYLRNDGTVTIATGRSRRETAWKNKELLWSALLEQFSVTTRTRETLAEFKRLSRADQDSIKDVGGFVGGVLSKSRRKAGNVAKRSLLTLDADYGAAAGLWDTITTLFDWGCAIYSTHKHAPESPRLRLVIPLQRQVTADEYVAVARRVAADINIEIFDDTTYEPHRLMYWPSTSCDGVFVFEYQDGAWLNPDEILARYDDWHDLSQWPTSSRTITEREKLAAKQEDPCAKEGLVGAFCRTYDIDEAIETFLPDIYGPCDGMPGRYTYLRGSTSGGLVVYDGSKFAYSHHGTDPVSGKLCNAFDLVRLHKFGDRDEDADPGTPTVKLPSYTAMQDLARTDAAVKQLMGEERLARAKGDFEVTGEWLQQLETDKKGNIQSTIDNLVLIMENDPNLTSFVGMNEFHHAPAMLRDVPWRKCTGSKDQWTDADDSGLRHYMEHTFNLSAISKTQDALRICMERHKYHPVRDYLDGLQWDGVKRIDTLLQDFLGATSDDFTRAVTRKVLAAAVARIYRPGIKFDYMLVLTGPQGQGKSFMLSRLGGSWYSDSFQTVQGKEAYEQLQGAWIIEVGELSATKKAEVEAVKHFISKQEDTYRIAYGHWVTSYPRQCVLIGTTNDATFLRDSTGNRRFWPVETGLQRPEKNLWKEFDAAYVAQIWAEAKTLYEAGEPLYLEGGMAEEARSRQAAHTEEDARAGIIREYLDQPLPEDWAERTVHERRNFLNGDFGSGSMGEKDTLVERQRVCVAEIWAECLGGDDKQLTKQIARELHDIMRNMPGWERYEANGGKAKVPGFGIQITYVRSDKQTQSYGILSSNQVSEDLEDLL